MALEKIYIDLDLLIDYNSLLFSTLRHYFKDKLHLEYS